MIKVAVALCLAAAAASPLAAQTVSPALPRDVTAFVEKRRGCDHFRGEYSEDRERARFIRQNVIRLCKGTDRRLAGLKRKYRADVTVMRILNDYETPVE